MTLYEPYSLINKARKFVGKKSNKNKKEEKKNTCPKSTEYRDTTYYDLITFPAISTNGLPKKKEKRPDFTQADFLAANEELAKTHNLIYRDEDVDEAISWLEPLTDVAVDIETYGTARGPARKKEALSFAKSRIRLIQLSSFARDETYLLDTMFLSTKAVAGILENLRGKALYCHNGIFDIPRLEKHFGVDLADEDIRDTLVLSRLARAGEWVKDRRTKTGMRPYRHDIRSVLIQEKVAETPNETDHRWHEPLNEERLRYAQDDVRHLIELYPRLMDLIEERSLGRGLELFKRVYPVYLRMQSRGVPFDKKLFSEFTEKLDAQIEVARSRIEEHKPEHPEGGTWSWRNNQPINDTDPATGAGRNGARRALLEAAINLPNLKKHTRLEYLKTHPGEAPLLDALHEYLRYSDLKSDCKTWLTYHYEDDRLYPNVKPFSQETGRSAYADPPIQNIPKEADEELGISLRDCIKAPQGTRLVKADYAAQELRILAHITGDEKLIASFAEGVDPHIVVGEQITGHSLEKGTTEYKTYRKLGKRANYGFSYGAGAARYAQSAYEDTAERVSEEQARAEQEAFRTAWPGVYKWQQEFGDADGTDETDWYTLSFVGRRRYVGQKKDKYSGGYKPSYCDRLNAPIQSGGADMLYVALELLLEDKEDGLFPEVEVIITTHDEIVLEAPEEVGKSTQAWLERRMQDAARRFLREELAGEDCVEGEVGSSWGGR